jgi:hypothetical protein
LLTDPIFSYEYFDLTGMKTGRFEFPDTTGHSSETPRLLFSALEAVALAKLAFRRKVVVALVPRADPLVALATQLHRSEAAVAVLDVDDLRIRVSLGFVESLVLPTIDTSRHRAKDTSDQRTFACREAIDIVADDRSCPSAKSAADGSPGCSRVAAGERERATKGEAGYGNREKVFVHTEKIVQLDQNATRQPRGVP